MCVEEFCDMKGKIKETFPTYLDPTSMHLTAISPHYAAHFLKIIQYLILQVSFP